MAASATAPKPLAQRRSMVRRDKGMRAWFRPVNAPVSDASQNLSSLLLRLLQYLRPPVLQSLEPGALTVLAVLLAALLAPRGWCAGDTRTRRLAAIASLRLLTCLDAHHKAVQQTRLGLGTWSRCRQRFLLRQQLALAETPHAARDEVQAKSRGHLVEQQPHDDHHELHHLLLRRLLLVLRRRHHVLLLHDHERNSKHGQNVQVRPKIEPAAKVARRAEEWNLARPTQQHVRRCQIPDPQESLQAQLHALL